MPKEAIKAGALDYIVKTPETFSVMPRIVERSLHEWAALQDRQRADAEVGHARQEWETTFDAMREVITIHDKQMRIVRANAAAYRMTGTAPDELLGKRCWEALWSKISVCSECPQVQTIWDGKSHCGVVHHQHNEKIFEVTTTPFPASSNLEYYIHVARDITTQKSMKNSLNFRRPMTCSPA